MWLSILKTVLGFLTGNALQELTGYLKDKKRIEGNLLNQTILAELRTRELAAEVVIMEQGWWVTKWIRPLFAYPLVFYYGAHCIDAVFNLPYTVAELPSPIDEWSGWIVTAYFFTRPFEKIFRGWMTGTRNN